jgi:hypothetical protein
VATIKLSRQQSGKCIAQKQFHPTVAAKATEQIGSLGAIKLSLHEVATTIQVDSEAYKHRSNGRCNRSEGGLRKSHSTRKRSNRRFNDAHN